VQESPPYFEKENSNMTEQLDRETMDLIAENAANRAITKHEDQNVSRLHWFEKDLKAYVDDKIKNHEAACPIGVDFCNCKAKLIGFAIGIAAGASGITVALSKLVGIL